MAPDLSNIQKSVTKGSIQRCLAARKNGISNKVKQTTTKQWLTRCAILQIDNDILSEEILDKLPLTSLCTCKCVSRLWRSLIVQNFDRSPRLPIICRIGLTTNPVRLCSIDTNTGLVTPIYSPIYLGEYNLVKPICSNGFVCYFNLTDVHNLVVFNPATQEKLLVPNTNDYGVHFGFDPCSNKFKLFGWTNYPHCEVYTLGTSSSWRTVTSTPIQGSGKPCSLLFCINGTIYWYSDTGMVISFHLGTESFGLIQGPNKDLCGSEETPIKKVDYMFDLEGCLCLAIIRVKPERILDLWKLKDQHNVNSGWVLIARVNMPLGKRNFWTCPYLTRTGEIVLAKCEEQGSNSFYLYSLLTRQFQNIKICGGDSYYILDNYKENLARLRDF
ncbi:hypothetical protein AQUCO_00500459v1 [Aquilegia coerulea]|uniref:F-box domain-containing protein n=1 Tax=Aquilegia coerulea TaxID=218851 RepID=A0A2G5ES42_AQUCA|nr:hypothetical protein AQUCO_00500459v1 [Aquilegia coerulea]